MLDAVTVIMAVQAAALATGRPPAPALFALHVAAALVALFAGGLYRIDWANFGRRDLAIIGAASAAAAALAWAAPRLSSTLPAADLRMLITGFAFVAAGLCGTRIFVRALDGHLRRIGGMARD